ATPNLHFWRRLAGADDSSLRAFRAERSLPAKQLLMGNASVLRSLSSRARYGAAPRRVRSPCREHYARAKVGQAHERLRFWLSGPHFYWSLRPRHNVVSAPSPVAGAAYI